MHERKSEKELERTMKALANRRRLAILRLLRKEKEMTVGALADQIRLSFRSTSKHLFVLSNAGLVECEQRSSQMFYSLASDIPEVARRVIVLL